MQQIVFIELTENGKRLTIDGDLGLLGHLVKTFERERHMEHREPTPEKQSTPLGQGAHNDRQ